MAAASMQVESIGWILQCRWYSSSYSPPDVGIA